MTAAYDDLPDEVKKRAEGLRGVHNYTQQYERRLGENQGAGRHPRGADQRSESESP
jgi:hypothetical protein